MERKRLSRMHERSAALVTFATTSVQGSAAPRKELRPRRSEAAIAPIL